MDNDDYINDMEQDYVKQVIVIRRKYPDGKGGFIKPRTGKLIAQGAHAAMKVILDRMKIDEFAKESTLWEGCYVWHMTVFESEPIHRWLKGTFTKIVVYVDSEEELLELKQKAEDAGILCALITDIGKTEFNGVRTNTALAIGPEWSSKIDESTGNLKLL